VGNDNIDVGNKAPVRKADRPGVAISGAGPQKRPQLRACGAMSQQSCDGGNQSSPQKFVQLVGYRDPKGRPDLSIRPRPAPAKP
jgi:hypothetical protein